MTSNENADLKSLDEVVEALSSILDQYEDISLLKVFGDSISRIFFGSKVNSVFVILIGITFFILVVFVILGQKTSVAAACVLIVNILLTLGFILWQGYTAIKLAEERHKNRKTNKFSDVIKKSFSGEKKSDLEEAFEPGIPNDKDGEKFKSLRRKLARCQLHHLKEAELKFQHRKELSGKNQQHANKIFPACLSFGLIVIIGNASFLPVMAGALTILFLFYDYDLEKYSASARIDNCLYILKEEILRQELKEKSTS